MENSKKYLNYVLQCLRERISRLDASIAEGEKEIETMHEYYWENYTEMDQYGYEDFDNQQALLNQVNANQEQLVQRQRFRNMLDSPFFGRVDFLYDGEESGETFYIGIANFSKETGGIPLIYDWRAPVSGLFYDYERGPASYEAPGGVMQGEILSKWQYKIRRGQMIYGFESDIKIDDEILMQELGSSGDTKLKNIIRTIQREQNAVIRNTKDHILVIQGVAGSGKTSVALHRIAYLLYHDRKNLKSSNILVLSPNHVFSDYISHILPELGEENIQEMSFDTFAYQELKGIVHDCEDRCDQLERNLMFPKAQEGYRKKQSREFMLQLRGYALELEDDLMDIRDFHFGNMKKTEEEITNLFYYKFPDLPLLSRMQAVMEYFIDEHETRTGRDFREEEKEQIEERFLRMYRTRDLYVLYSRFLEENGYTPLPRLPREERLLCYEDVAPMLYLKYLLYGNNGQKRIRHLVIDEMQDYSYLQYEILNRLFSCKMTILGDKAQTLDDEMRDVTQFLPGILGKTVKIIHMNKSYRNTVEISEYANRIAHISGMELFERHGRPVEEQTFGSLEDALEQVIKSIRFQKHVFETAAVLTMTAEEAGYAYAYLKRRLSEQEMGKDPGISCIDRDSTKFCKGLTVTTFYFAKGLEFDQVFAVFKDSDQSPAHQQARYICATRAIHELYIYEYAGTGTRPGMAGTQDVTR